MQIFLGEFRVSAHESHQPLDDVVPLRILLEDRPELCEDLDCHVSILFTGPTESLFSYAVQHRFIEATHSDAHDSKHKLIIFLN